MLKLNKTLNLNDITNNISESIKQNYEYEFFSNSFCNVFQCNIKESYFVLYIDSISYTFRLINNELNYTLISCFDQLNFKELKIN